MTWKRWIGSLINAGMSGAVTAVMGGMVGLTPKQIGLMALTSFLFSAGKWYQQHPPPGVETVVESVKVEPLASGGVQSTTVTKTTQDPAQK